MESAPLDKAYTAAKNADAATLVGDYTKAGALHGEAAEQFALVAEECPQNPAVQLLLALAKQHRARSKYLSSGKARQDAARGIAVSPTSYQSSVVSQLSVARGVAPAQSQSQSQSQSQPQSQSQSANTIASERHIAASLDVTENITRLLTKANKAFVKSFEAAIKASRTDPSESFYLVGEGSDDKGELPALQHALEAATRSQRQVFKPEMQSIAQELAIREQRLFDFNQDEMDRLRAENDALKVQVSKLRSRWDGLKESARKRREELLN